MPNRLELLPHEGPLLLAGATALCRPVEPQPPDDVEIIPAE